jgi:hypothetical protein
MRGEIDGCTSSVSVGCVLHQRRGGIRCASHIAILLILATIRCAAQDTLAYTDGFPHVNGWTTRKTIATAAVGVVVLTKLMHSYYAWWKGAEKPFTFLGHEEENWLAGPHQGVDKPGHFFGTYVIYKTIRNILLWGGHDKTTAFWWVAGRGLWNGLEIEIGDAFSP